MFQLPAGEVHVWHVLLDVPPDRARRLAGTLAPEESARADRFRSPTDRTRYIVARGVLRSVLGAYLGEDARDVKFFYGAAGKPELVPRGVRSLGGDILRFNLSHSHGRAVVALNRGRRIGADIERVRPIDDMDALTQRFFSASERSDLSGVAEGEKLLAFFTCWTRKEAWVKATGEGVGTDLTAFSVSLAVGRRRSCWKCRPTIRRPAGGGWPTYRATRGMSAPSQSRDMPGGCCPAYGMVGRNGTIPNTPHARACPGPPLLPPLRPSPERVRELELRRILSNASG